MKKRSTKKRAWAPGDVFAVPQRDGICSLGQVITLMMQNVVSCAFYDIRVDCEVSSSGSELPTSRLVSALSVSREQLDYGVWKIIGNQKVVLDEQLWPNEEFRANGWIGARIYDATIAESLLNAFYGLIPWDRYKDPEYLDKLLAYPDRRPKNVVLSRPRSS